MHVSAAHVLTTMFLIDLRSILMQRNSCIIEHEKYFFLHVVVYIF